MKLRKMNVRRQRMKQQQAAARKAKGTVLAAKKAKA
jgi:hypothetical protein